MDAATMPLVSVGITTYNRPDYLKLALDGVLRQTYRNLEIIISADCTPCEKTRVLLQEYAQRDSRIRLFNQPTNIGPPANFQFVLKQATGAYFFWADDDDLRDERWVEMLLPKLADGNTVVALSKVVSIDLEGRVVKEYRPLRYAGSRPLRLASFFLAEAAEGKANIVCGMYRTAFLRSVRHWGEYDRNLFAVDVLFVFDCLQHGNVEVDASVTLYKRLPVGKSFPVSSARDFIQRVYRRVEHDFVCVSIVDNLLDKALLLLLIPVKLVKQLAYKVALRIR